MTELTTIENKKVCITGGLGFIGSALAKTCVKYGATVMVLDNLDVNSGSNYFNIESFKDYIEVVVGDITDYEFIAGVVKDLDIIVNCAASTSHSYSMREPFANLNVNGRGVITLLEAIKLFNPTIKFVQIGTSTQVGKMLYSPVDEVHPEFPPDIYSANKTAAEKYSLIYSKTYDLQVTVIRLSNTFGPRAAIHSPEFTFNSYFIGRALNKEPIQVYGQGAQLRNVLYIDDAVEAIVTAIQHQKSVGEVFFAVGDSHYSVFDIANATADIFGGTVKFVDWPQNRKVIEIGDAVISNEKIKNILKWSPKVDLHTGLERTREYFDKHSEHYLK